MKKFTMSVSAALAIIPIASGAMTFTAGDYYATTGQLLGHFSKSGALIETMPIVSGTRQVYGIAFRDENNLYVVTDNYGSHSAGSARIEVLNSKGELQSEFTIKDSLSYSASGSIEYDSRSDSFYVSTSKGLVQYGADGSSKPATQDYGTIGQRSFASIADGSFVTINSSLLRYDSSGKKVGTVPTNIEDPQRLIDNSWSMNHVMGIANVAFDPLSDTLYVTASGYSGFYDKVMAFDGVSNVLKGISEFGLNTDMVVAPDGRILLGSGWGSMGIFEMSATGLQRIALADSMPNQAGYGQRYVAAIPMSAPVPELTSFSMLLIGLLCLLARGRVLTLTRLRRNVGS